MANNQIEVEVKFRIGDLGLLENKIKNVGGRELHKNIFQRTIRMDTPKESLRDRGVFLRVRDGEKKVMTVKSKISGADENFKERQELEIEVNDISLAEQMMESLGFTQKWIMEKYRTEYELDRTVLALDHLPFGDYLEIEGEKAEIEKVINLLDLQDEERLVNSYWHLFDDYKKTNSLTGENIVFE